MATRNQSRTSNRNNSSDRSSSNRSAFSWGSDTGPSSTLLTGV